MTSPSNASTPIADIAGKIAHAALSGKCDLLHACRQLADLLSRRADCDSKLVDVFAGVASETEGLPIGDERQYWAADALKAKDIEAAEYREQVRAVVEAALRRLPPSPVPMTGQRVCIVMNPAFGSRLAGIRDADAIWIVASAENEAAARQLRAAGHADVTTFDAEPFDALVPTVEEHHPNWRVLEIYGLAHGETTMAFSHRPTTVVSLVDGETCIVRLD